MIRFLDPRRFYTNRQYLTQWFPGETLCITDNDLEDISRTRELLAEHPNPRRILDITHNPWPDSRQSIDIYPRLTNNFEFFYRPSSGVFFFPLFLWMYSSRNLLWWEPASLDQTSDKTREIVCLNNQPRPHRTQVWAECNRRGIIDQFDFSFNFPLDHEKEKYNYPYPLTIANEVPTLHRPNNIGVEHPVYRDCAVNLVTETAVDLTYISEKTCKPFVARQIPILVGGCGINQFMSDVGLDMFSDLVPWPTWDSTTDSVQRIYKIMDFVESWIRSGTVLDDYRKLLPRIQANKQYFHSEKFRQRIMNQMPSQLDS